MQCSADHRTNSVLWRTHRSPAIDSQRALHHESQRYARFLADMPRQFHYTHLPIDDVYQKSDDGAGENAMHLKFFSIIRLNRIHVPRMQQRQLALKTCWPAEFVKILLSVAQPKVMTSP